MMGPVVRWVVVPLSAVVVLSLLAGAVDKPLASFAGAFAKGVFLGWWYTIQARRQEGGVRGCGRR